MNNIKIGQLYQHTPTGIVRRVVFVGDNYVTLKRGDCDYSRFGNIENFKKFWRPYEAPNDKAHDDKVNHPSHYNQGNIECIDALIAAHGKQAVADFCLCNAHKYIWRTLDKNGKEDCDKAIWYLNKYKELKYGKEE